jgi:Zn-dependent protease with chaperone function
MSVEQTGLCALAEYLDGRITRVMPVVAQVKDKRLFLEGPRVLLSFPLSQVRLAPRVSNTVRCLSLPNGAKCAVADHVFMDDLVRRLGGGSVERIMRRIESTLAGQILCVTALALVLVSVLKWGIPGLASYMVDAMPAAAAEKFGQGVLAYLDTVTFEPSRLPEDRRAALESRFQDLKDRYPDLPLGLTFRSGAGPNAFALPDGTVVLTDALVELATRDQQLLGVLAHEVGHLQHRHNLKGLLEGSASALVVAFYLADVSQISDWAAWLPSALVDASYSRAQESEADEFALRYLESSGTRPYHLADLFRTLHRQRPEPDQVLRYLSTHPIGADRIAYFDKESPASEYPKAREIARGVTNIGPDVFHMNGALIQVLEEPDISSGLVVFREAQTGVRLVQARRPEVQRRDEEFEREMFERFGVHPYLVTDEQIAALGPDRVAQFERERSAHARWWRNDFEETVLGLLGLEPLDVVQAIDGVSVTDFESASRAISAAKTKSVVEIRVLRRGQARVLRYQIYR